MTVLPNPPTPEREGTSKKFPTILLILAGIGCGCFGLLILMGILAAILLPSLLNQADKARQAEARNNVGAMARGQQAYLWEENTFAETLEELGIGIQANTQNYTYAIVPQSDPSLSVYITATPKKIGLNSYSAGVFRPSVEEGNSIWVICESDRPENEPPSMPAFDPDAETATCPEGSTSLD
ncbi:MAG: type IV pilin-like G/H family protein [Spirulina sp.]